MDASSYPPDLIVRDRSELGRESLCQVATIIGRRAHGFKVRPAEVETVDQAAVREPEHHGRVKRGPTLVHLLESMYRGSWDRAAHEAWPA